MSTSFMYHAFGTVDYKYLKTCYEKGCITVFLAKRRDKQRCAVCNSHDITRHGGRHYLVRTLPIGTKPVLLDIYLNQLHCRACGARRQEPKGIADPRKTYTRALARFVIGLSQCMTLQDISKFLKMGWHQVRDIVRDHLEKKAARRSWREVRYIAIDEIAVRKGHHYMTVVVNLMTGAVLEVVEGRRAESLEPVFKRLKRARAKLSAIAIDMSPSYRKAISMYAPDVPIVYDPFHVVQNVNFALEEVRIAEQARLTKEGKNILKGCRFLLLKGREKLEKNQSGSDKLKRMLELNQALYKAYLLKEDLRQFWAQDCKQKASEFLSQWIETALSTGLPAFKRFARTLERHQEGILAWYDHRISTGPLEGLNNKIKVLKRRAYGYRNKDFFRLLVLFIHNSQFRLNST